MKKVQKSATKSKKVWISAKALNCAKICKNVLKSTKKCKQLKKAQKSAKSAEKYKKVQKVQNIDLKF